MLGLCFCARAFSSCGKRGPLFIAVRRPLTIAASLVAEHRLQTRKLSSCGSRAQLFRGMWDPPRPGLEPVSPALAGRFSTTTPPEKPEEAILVSLSKAHQKKIINKYLISHVFTLAIDKKRWKPKGDFFLNRRRTVWTVRAGLGYPIELPGTEALSRKPEWPLARETAEKICKPARCLVKMTWGLSSTTLARLVPDMRDWEQQACRPRPLSSTQPHHPPSSCSKAPATGVQEDGRCHKIVQVFKNSCNYRICQLVLAWPEGSSGICSRLLLSKFPLPGGLSHIPDSINYNHISPTHNEPLRYQIMLSLCLQNYHRMRSWEGVQSVSVDDPQAPWSLSPTNRSPSPSGPSCRGDLGSAYCGESCGEHG